MGKEILTSGNIELDSEPIYDKKFLKTKIKFHCDEVTNFYDNKILKVGSSHTCFV